MRLHWTVETDGSIILREPNQAARAIVKRRSEDWGFSATILEPGLPGAGPYKSRDTAAKFIHKIIHRFIPDATFGEIPPIQQNDKRDTLRDSQKTIVHPDSIPLS